MLAERWGMLARTADDRIKAAREAIKNDISVIDRQELGVDVDGHGRSNCQRS